MTTRPKIRWRWKGSKKFTEGYIQQEMERLIKIADHKTGQGWWYLKDEIDVEGWV